MLSNWPSRVGISHLNAQLIDKKTIYLQVADQLIFKGKYWILIIEFWVVDKTVSRWVWNPKSINITLNNIAIKHLTPILVVQHKHESTVSLLSRAFSWKGRICNVILLNWSSKKTTEGLIFNLNTAIVIQIIKLSKSAINKLHLLVNIERRNWRGFLFVTSRNPIHHVY